ncbi:MAG: alpha-galactosidase [Gloeobacteraceae cyanobacterium ES-bin-144]|nr:alpha-galactosidase [Verrucomicrobiales bacterium]
MKNFTLILIALTPCLFAAEQKLEFKSCYARWNENELVLGNAKFERKWRIKDGLLTATSFRNLKTGMEWIREACQQPAPVTPAWRTAAPGLTISASSGRLDVTGEESLQVLITTKDKQTSVCRFRIFPEASGVEILAETNAESPATNNQSSGKTTIVVPDGVEEKKSVITGGADSSLENLMLSPRHLRLTQVNLMDQSDIRSELVQEHEWMLMNERDLILSGNVFVVENTANEEGLIFVKFAPLPHARPVKSPYDCEINASRRQVGFSGDGYPCVLLTYSGGVAGRTEVIHGFQRQMRKYQPDRDGAFLSNTWGDRSKDGRVNEAFLLKEIDAAARLGVDVVQIDDGWQKGMTGNSAFGKGAWGKFYQADPNFWSPHPTRFPNGLKPLIDAAKERHMKFGLWFAPDSENENIHWERDADLILENFRKYGVEYVKIDAVEIATRKAESNLQKFYNKVLAGSNGRVTFDLDATAGMRPTYFDSPTAGPIFVENRYTDWQSYWPHLTLRNLWKLSHYVDPLRLRMEFLNNARNLEKYGDDPLAPARYSPDALFATVMFSSPLGWFEVSNLPEDYQKSVSALATIWKRERTNLFSGNVLPIGQAPDGHQWTGFASVAQDRESGYILLFRELNQSAEWSMELNLFSEGHRNIRKLAGKGEATVTGNRLTVNIPDTLQYLWLRIE